MKESPYPVACLFASCLVAIVSVTASPDREMTIAGLGFASSLLTSGGTAYHYEQIKGEDGKDRDSL